MRRPCAACAVRLAAAAAPAAADSAPRAQHRDVLLPRTAMLGAQVSALPGHDRRDRRTADDPKNAPTD